MCVIKEIYRDVLYILDKEQNIIRKLKFCRLECYVLDQIWRISFVKYGCLES